MIADAQALTDNYKDVNKVKSNIIEVALDYMAVGIDPTKSVIFIQSLIPELCELTFYYMNLVTVARLRRNPTVKEEIKKPELAPPPKVLDLLLIAENDMVIKEELTIIDSEVKPHHHRIKTAYFVQCHRYKLFL